MFIRMRLRRTRLDTAHGAAVTLRRLRGKMHLATFLIFIWDDIRIYTDYKEDKLHKSVSKAWAEFEKKSITPFNLCTNNVINMTTKKTWSDLMMFIEIIMQK